MKIEVDFVNKTIEVKDFTTIGQLIEKLKELNFPDWENYTLKQGYSFYPVYPACPSIPAYPSYPVYPLNPTYITIPSYIP